MLNVDRLRALHAVATLGSVQAAADALHVSTSAVSQQLSKLEEEVGHQLLARQGRGVRLTDAAGLLVAHTAQVLAALERASADLDAAHGQVVGHITVGIFPTAARGLAPAVLAGLSRQHQRMRVTLVELEPCDSLPRLVRGEIDVVLALDWCNAPLAIPDGLSKAPVFDDVADIALPSGHRLAKKRVVTLRDLAGEPWVTWRAGEPCHDWLVHTLRMEGIQANVAHTAGEHATLLAFVGAGLGACVLPRLGRDALPSGVSIVRVTPALTRHVYALWRADATRRPGVRATVDAFQAEGRRIANIRSPRASARGEQEHR